jgi:hypothetical protein
MPVSACVCVCVCVCVRVFCSAFLCLFVCVCVRDSVAKVVHAGRVCRCLVWRAACRLDAASISVWHPQAAAARRLTNLPTSLLVIVILLVIHMQGWG